MLADSHWTRNLQSSVCGAYGKAGNGSGMEVEWKWNGSGMEVEWKLETENGNGNWKRKWKCANRWRAVLRMRKVGTVNFTSNMRTRTTPACTAPCVFE